MSYTDLRDFSEEYKTTTDDGLTVQIEKLGGGTVGNAYTGTWRYIVTNASGVEVARGQDCETGMPHTHAQVAVFVADTYVPTGTWEVGYNFVGSPREAAESFDTWADAAETVRNMACEWADEDDEERDEDDDENTRAVVDSMLSPIDGVGPEKSEDTAWSMWVEDSNYHRVEFWIQPKVS